MRVFTDDKGPVGESCVLVGESRRSGVLVFPKTKTNKNLKLLFRKGRDVIFYFRHVSW